MSQLPISDLELAYIRDDAAQLFKDVGVIERITTLGVLDHDTAEFVGEVRATIYDGPCSIYPIESRRDRFDEFGQGLIFTRQYRVSLPWDEEDIQIRDLFHLTISNDPQAINREMEVRDVFVSTLLGYRRLTVQDTVE